MSDDDKSMNVWLIFNQHLLTYTELRGMNPMGLSALWSKYKTNNYSQK